MKLIFDFEYLQQPLEGESKTEIIKSAKDHPIPNIGETIYWRMEEDVLPYKVEDKGLTYENGRLIFITLFLVKA